MERLYKKEVYKSKDFWLKARGLGGSSASAILGVNPYMTKIELYRAIVMPNDKPLVKENESMAYGTRCEPIIRKLFAYDFKGKYIVHTPKNFEMYRRIDKPYLTATLDGVLRVKGIKRKGVLEIKTHDIRNAKDEQEWDGHLPQHYFIQVLHYLLVLNDFDFIELTAKLRFFDYFNPTGKKLIKTEVRYYHIERADVMKDLEFLEKEETNFWENNVMKKVMPQLQIKF